MLLHLYDLQLLVYRWLKPLPVTIIAISLSHSKWNKFSLYFSISVYTLHCSSNYGNMLSWEMLTWFLRLTAFSNNLPCLAAGFVCEVPYFGIMVTGYGLTGMSISLVSHTELSSDSSPHSRNK